MRIAFVGKGGSGKTTVSSLYSLWTASKGRTVLAMDADINQHLAQAIGYQAKLPAMGEDLARIKTHLAGTNPRLSPETMHKTTPPGRGSQLVRLAVDDWFMCHYTRQHAGVHLAGAGEIPAENIGVKCYHGLNGAIELVLGHLMDGPDDRVVVDMTAGADAFSSSLFTKVDAIVLVVEPTLKSLSVQAQFAHHLQGYDIPLLVVANKVEDEADLRFITDTVGPVVVSLPPARFVKRRERGEALALDQLDEAVQTGLEQLEVRIGQLRRDWQALEQRSHAMHRRNAESWMGAAAAEQIDPEFSLGATARS